MIARGQATAVLVVIVVAIAIALVVGGMFLGVLAGAAVTEVETDRLVCGVLGSSAISCVPKVPGLFGELDR